MKRYQLKSMTAYGRGTSVFPQGRFIVEIQSVNRRHLEINLVVPRLFMRFEVDMRKQVAASVGRGMLNVFVSWKTEGAQPVTVMPNLPLARALKDAWEKLAHELGRMEAVPLALLAQEKDLLLYEEEILDEEAYQRALNAALKQALDALQQMKREEGGILAQDLKERLCILHTEIASIEALSGEGTEKYRQKLQERLEELFSGSPENEERLLREIAIYAERVDITEEIVRFKGHLDQIEHMVEKPLENELETRGKTLDFLLQELLREITTIGSKAASLPIAQHVVVVKSELEKIREQVQNIE
jgi:uncharacterized protein (TIGR00255 family)